MGPMTLNKAFVAIIIASLVTFFTRAFPFIFYSKHTPPAIIIFIEKYIPPMMMVVLVFYCLKDISWTKSPFGLAEVISITFVVIIHLWKSNPLISIFGGTILYMALIQTGVLQRLF